MSKIIQTLLDEAAKPWYTGKPDPKFKRSVELLKNWFVENEKEHA